MPKHCTFLMYDAPASSQREQAPRETNTHDPTISARGIWLPRPRSIGRSSLYSRGAGAESTTGFSKANEEYSRIVNHAHCDQDLLHICMRAINLKYNRTGKAETQPEEFMWRCLAKPEYVRSCLKQEATYHFLYGSGDPVKYLIPKVGEIMEEWKKGTGQVHSNQRWKVPCIFCGSKPYVSWDACFRCGSIRGS